MQKKSSAHSTPSRRALLGLGLGVASAALLSIVPAAATDWPTRPVTVIVPYSAGGNTDMMARLASEYLSSKLGQSFVVENRPGGGGSVGAVATARSAPDGYTFMFGASTQMINIPMMQKVPYDPVKDFTPVSIFGAGPYLLGVKASLPVNNLKEFIDYVRANPGKLNYATAGRGGNVHLNSALFLSVAKLDMVAVPYKSGAPAMAGLAAGEVEMYFGNASELMQHVNNDRIKILAVSTLKPLPQLPTVPTVHETFPGFDTSSWNGFIAPAGTPQPILDKLEKYVIEAARDPKVVERLNRIAIIPYGTTQAEFKETLDKSRVSNATALDAAGIVVLK